MGRSEDAGLGRRVEPDDGMAGIAHCPTCGSSVRVVGGDEGTAHYAPNCGRFSSDPTEACVPLADHMGAVKALERIAKRTTVERNPDGVDQAAATMKLIASSALDRIGRR